MGGARSGRVVPDSPIYKEDTGELQAMLLKIRPLGEADIIIKGNRLEPLVGFIGLLYDPVDVFLCDL